MPAGAVALLAEDEPGRAASRRAGAGLSSAPPATAPARGAAAGPARLAPSRVAATSVAGDGRPLPGGLRSRFEAGFASDLSDVRVHSGPAAARASDQLDAHAFTSGRDITVGGGYAPGTRDGERLLAHEVAHVLQHRQGPAAASGDDGAAEVEADRAADRVAGGERAGPLTARAPAISRQPKGGDKAGVANINVNCADMKISFDGPRPFSWDLTSCDMPAGDYDAVVAADSRTTTFHLDVPAAPEGEVFRFSYAVMRGQPDPLDLVKIGQAVKLHATAKPAKDDKDGGQEGMRFQVAAVDVATYEALSGRKASDLTPGHLDRGFTVISAGAASPLSLPGGLGAGGLGAGGLGAGGDLGSPSLTPGAGFGMLNANPYAANPVKPPGVPDMFANTDLFGDQWPVIGGAYENMARSHARATGGFVPSWALDPATQNAWRNMPLSTLAPQEMQLVEDVLNTAQVIAGRSVNVRGQGGFVLDDWLISHGIKWTQRWQDVYNRALYARTSSGIPINAMSGAGYSAGEVNAAEAGAHAGGIKNEPFFPEPYTPLRDVMGKLPPEAPPVGLRARMQALPPGTFVRGVVRAGGTILLIYGVVTAGVRIAEAKPEERFQVAGQELGAFAGGWIGATLSSALAGAVICSETGPGALVCGLAFGIAGGITGSTIGGNLGGRAAAGLQGVGEMLANPAQMSDAAALMLLDADQRKQYFDNKEFLQNAGF